MATSCPVTGLTGWPPAVLSLVWPDRGMTGVDPVSPSLEVDALTTRPPRRRIQRKTEVSVLLFHPSPGLCPSTA